MPRTSVPPRLGEGLVSRRLIVGASDAILVKALIEAYEGVASVFAESAGDLTIAAPADRAHELDEILRAVEELLRSRR